MLKFGYHQELCFLVLIIGHCQGPRHKVISFSFAKGFGD